MKTIFLFFALSLFFNLKGQSIGIVSNINPNMGHIHTKSGLKFNPIFEKDLDFNIETIISNTLTENQKEFSYFFDFDWEKLGYFTDKTKAKPILEYLQKYSNEKGIEELFIIRKLNSYRITDISAYSYYFNYNAGILSFPAYKKRCVFFYNFIIYKYSVKDNSIYIPLLEKSERINDMSIKKFPENVYDENQQLYPHIIEYYTTAFNKHIKTSIIKLINQNEKDIYTFKK